MNFVYHVKSFGCAPYVEAVLDDWRGVVEYSNNVLQEQFKNHERFSGKYTYKDTTRESSGMLVVSCDFINCPTSDGWKYMGIIAEGSAPAKFRPSVDI